MLTKVKAFMADTLYIIDDEEDILFSLFIWFKKIGYEVKTFSNSKDLLKNFGQQQPDLILLDVNLNGEDGREVCKVLKTELRCHAPVLLFSANPYNGENYKQCKAAGFINKPFTLTEISKVIASHITHP